MLSFCGTIIFCDEMHRTKIWRKLWEFAMLTILCIVNRLYRNWIPIHHVLGVKKSVFYHPLILYMNEHWTYLPSTGLSFVRFCQHISTWVFNIASLILVKVWWSKFRNQYFVLSLKIFNLQRTVHLLCICEREKSKEYELMIFSCSTYILYNVVERSRLTRQLLSMSRF